MHLGQVQESLEGFAQRGVQVIAVGQGTGDEAAQFCTQWQVGFPCVGDPNRSSYGEYQLKRGTWWSVVLKQLLTRPLHTIRLILDADSAGLRLAATDVMQLPGIAVVESGGALRALHVAESPEDMPTPEEVWEVIDRLRLDAPLGRRRE